MTWSLGLGSSAIFVILVDLVWVQHHRCGQANTTQGLKELRPSEKRIACYLWMLGLQTKAASSPKLSGLNCQMGLVTPALDTESRYLSLLHRQDLNSDHLADGKWKPRLLTAGFYVL